MKWAALLLCGGLVFPPCGASTPPAGGASDAPDPAFAVARAALDAPPSYAQALQRWQSAVDINAWIGQHFRYDMPRALQLSESQRAQKPAPAIHEPAAFYARPDGVCVDLARFAVETLQAVAPQARARYLMIEFDPVTLDGQTLRRHWVATFERDGELYAFGDSRRPGHIAGPYPDVAAFIADYARYRGRAIVAHNERATFQRTTRVQASRQPRAPQ